MTENKTTQPDHSTAIAAGSPQLLALVVGLAPAVLSRVLAR